MKRTADPLVTIISENRMKKKNATKISKRRRIKPSIKDLKKDQKRRENH